MLSLSRYLNRQGGQTLIEVTFAAVILLLVVGSAIQLAITALQIGGEAEMRESAAVANQTAVEALVNIRDNVGWPQFLTSIQALPACYYTSSELSSNLMPRTTDVIAPDSPDSPKSCKVNVNSTTGKWEVLSGVRDKAFAPTFSGTGLAEQQFARGMTQRMYFVDTSSIQAETKKVRVVIDTLWRNKSSQVQVSRVATCLTDYNGDASGDKGACFE